MAKTMKKTARKVPACSMRNAKKQDDVNCELAGAETRTIKTALSQHHNTAIQSHHIRKCVVKIKRIKLHANDVAAELHNLRGAPSVQPSVDIASTAAENIATVTTSVLNNEESHRIRKCVVRINRNKLQAHDVGTERQNGDLTKIRNCFVRINRIELQAHDVTAKMNKHDEISAVDTMRQNGDPIEAVANTLTDNVGDVTLFEPARNSTMCTNSKEPTARDRIPQNAASCFQGNVTANKSRFFHRDQPPARSRSSVTRNVYEFLSQSQIEDNEVKDPAADIIKRLVKEGKACVMTRKKGKSRMRAVRKRLRPVGKRRQCSLRSIGENPKSDVLEEDPLPPIEQPLSPIYEPQIDSSDEENAPNEPVLLDVPVQVHEPRKKQAHSEGAYSPMARSLLLNKTKIQNPQDSIDRRRELLNMAKKYVSTPMNRKSHPANTASASTFSPIGLDKSASRRMATFNSPSNRCSPWRVDDNAHLPNTFVFGLNTSHLPSYSSDFIRGRRHVYVPGEPVPEEENEASCIDLNEQSSSTVSNDSNGENVPPPQKVVTEAPPLTPIKPSEGKENENAENYVQLPNPRLTLQHRSPLKDINILEVVLLPSWKKNVPAPKTPTRESVVSNHVHFGQTIDNEANRSSPNNLNTQFTRKQQQAGNLFGFEDFLDDDNEESTHQHSVNQNLTLHEKLQRLGTLRPADEELPQVSKEVMRHAYDDLEAHEPRQRNIKEMFCSTMVATTAPRVPSTDDSVALFKDTDPETTFDEKKPRRTYVRERPKRKRKQRVHILFVDSGTSDSEDNEQGSKENSADSPKKTVPAHKRPRKDAEHEAKLKQFVTSFNQECEEVEKFPLIIE